MSKRIENELFLKLMSSTSTLAFLVVDNRTDEILHFNHKFCEIWGITHLEAQMQRGELTNNQIIPDCLAVLADIPAFAESCKPLQSEENRITLEDYIPFLDGRTIRRFSTQMRGDDDAYFGRFYLFEDISEQRNVENKLKESEANFRTFFETVDDILLVGNPEGRIIYANTASVTKLGYPLEELIGMHILDVHPAEKRAEAEQIFGDMFAGKRSTCPLPLSRKDISFLSVETRVWFGKWDGLDCIFGISKDLTLQQAAFDKFQKIFDNNPSLMAVTNMQDKKFTDVNSTFLKKLGYTKAEVIGKTTLELGLFIENEKQVEAQKVLQQVGKLTNFELQARKKDGGILDGLFSGEMIDNQLEQSYLTVMNDITDIRKIEGELFKTEEKFSSIMSNMRDVVWSAVWPSLERLYISPSVQALYGMGDHAINEKAFNWFELIYPEDRESVEKNLEALEKSGDSQLEFRIIRANGDIIWVDERLKLIFDINQLPIRVDGIMRDITARKKQEEEIEYYSKMQDLILKISSVYINIDLSEFDNTMEKSLQEIAEFVGADRSYIFEYDFVNDTTSNTHEWCGEGINPEIMNLQNIPLVSIPQWVEKHLLGDAFYVDDVSILPQDGQGSLRYLLENRAIKSMITVPMINDGILIGCVGFDSVKSKHAYTEREKELLVIFAQMLVNVKKRIIEEQLLIESVKLKDKIMETETAFLQAQIKPHFLYNALNAIANICEKDGSKASKLILDLAVYLRGSLEFNNLDKMVSLEKELEFVDTYFHIEEARFGNKIRLVKKIEVPLSYQLPVLMLQPLVENAVRHGISKKLCGGTVYLSIVQSDGNVEIEIRDNGMGMDSEKLATIFAEDRIEKGVGLININNRLQRLYGNYLAISSEQGIGTCVKISLAKEGK